MRKSKIIIYILSIILIIGIILIVLLKSSNNTELQESTEISEIDVEKRILLADMLKEDDEILITEDNIDRTNEIINRANLKEGIFITENSREKFLEIVNISTENIYSIDNEGYLKKNTNITKENDLTKKINNYIDSKGTIVINISNTYKGLLNGMQLDFMIERTAYIQIFEYNDNIKIGLINPDKIDEQLEDISQKEIYEEILLGI